MLPIPVQSKPFTTQSHLYCPCKTKKTLENILGKGENAGNQHFLLFPQRFLSYLTEIEQVEPHGIYRLQN